MGRRLHKASWLHSLHHDWFDYGYPVEKLRSGLYVSYMSVNNLENGMEQIRSEGMFAGFARQLRQNGSFLLIVLIASGALLYFIIGMFAILGH